MTVYNREGNSLEVTIRLARPDEGSKLVRLLKKQHGNNYPIQKIYDENYVSQNIEEGSLRFAVVEMSDGTLAGMTGSDAKNVFSGAMMFFLQTLEPSVRGFGLGKVLHHFLLQAVNVDAHTCVYGHCLTLDTASQRICNHLGYKMTGLILNRYIYDTNAVNLSGLPLPLKRTHLIACIPGGKQDAGMIYAPSRHAAFISAVYEYLGVRYNLMEETRSKNKPGQTNFTLAQYELHRYCELMVQNPADGFEDILGGILKQYAALENQSFNAFINLNDPCCPSLCLLLEAHGFFFTGLQTLAGPYEYMVLHYSPSLPVPFERISVIPEFEERLTYIKARYLEAKNE
jgi:hypothetical protein